MVVLNVTSHLSLDCHQLAPIYNCSGLLTASCQQREVMLGGLQEYGCHGQNLNMVPLCCQYHQWQSGNIIWQCHPWLCWMLGVYQQMGADLIP